MTWVDGVILGIIAISGLLAFMRGFVREVLGIGAWIGAAALAVWANPRILPTFERWLHDQPGLAQPVAFGVVFLITLVVLLIICHAIGKAVRRSAFGGLDRSLGLLFGLARGAALVVLAYIVVAIAVPVDQWPQPVVAARAMPFAYQGAVWAAHWLPDAYRPRVYSPPGGRSATEEALLRATPQGRALGKPPARE
jgi:membrane protein required for colicin V production